MTGVTSPGERVLVVARDRVLRAGLVDQFAAAGHSVIGVATGAEGLNVLSHFTATALVADWNAVDAAGENLIRSVRSSPAGHILPVLALGDSEHAAEFQELLELGRIWYIARGAEWLRLERTFQTMLARTEARVAGL